MKDFLERFKFKHNNSLMVGIERECFLTNGNNQIAPISDQVLKHFNANKNGRFGFELSACQLEDRIGPCSLGKIKEEILKNEKIISLVELEFGFRRLYIELAPDDMPLDIYPDPTGRYQKIAKKMSHNVLLAACQVAGIHVHVGMPNHEVALKVYNNVINHCDELCMIGDGSNGKRLEVYKIVAPNCAPIPYEDWLEFYQYAVKENFVLNPRNCWHLIRISVHGTIEFRMFGSTSDIDKTVFFAEKCHNLCQNAMES